MARISNDFVLSHPLFERPTIVRHMVRLQRPLLGWRSARTLGTTRQGSKSEIVPQSLDAASAAGGLVRARSEAESHLDPRLQANSQSGKDLSQLFPSANLGPMWSGRSVRATQRAVSISLTARLQLHNRQLLMAKFIDSICRSMV